MSSIIDGVLRVVGSERTVTIDRALLRAVQYLVTPKYRIIFRTEVSSHFSLRFYMQE